MRTARALVPDPKFSAYQLISHGPNLPFTVHLDIYAFGALILMVTASLHALQALRRLSDTMLLL